MTWIHAADLNELKTKGQLAVTVSDRSILLIYDNAQVFAVENLCSHAYKPLENSNVMNKIIECKYHGGRFCLKTGEHLSPPAFKGIQTFPTQVKSNSVSIKLET